MGPWPTPADRPNHPHQKCFLKMEFIKGAHLVAKKPICTVQWLPTCHPAHHLTCHPNQNSGTELVGHVLAFCTMHVALLFLCVHPPVR